jgi:hypothetical protein
VTARKAEKPEDHRGTMPRSRRLFQAGFKTRADAERCMKAITSDLAADRIGAMEANQLTAVTLHRMRDFDRQASRDAQTRKRVTRSRP